MDNQTPAALTGFLVRPAALVLVLASGLTGQAVYVPNYTTSSVSGYVMNPSTGALAVIPGLPVKTGTSPIQALIHPSGKYLYVLNAGSGDIGLYAISAPTGMLTALPCPRCEALSPSGMAMDPAGQSLFATSAEYGTVSAYYIDLASGWLTRGATISTGAGSKPVNPVVEPGGRYLYVANSGTGQISGFQIAGGSLTSVPGSPFRAGTSPIGVAASRSAVFVANQTSGDISVYRLGQDGALTQSGIPVPAGGLPTSVAVDPTGNYVYVANQNQLVAFNLTSNGLYPLTYLRAYNAGTAPSYAAVDPDGKFVYVVNTVSNDVSGFSISAGGTLLPAGSASTTGASGPRVPTVRHIGDTTGISVLPGYPSPLNTAPYGTAVEIRGLVRNTLNPGTLPTGSVTVTVNDQAIPNGTVPLDAAAGFSVLFNSATMYLPVGVSIIQAAYNPGTGFEAPAPLRVTYSVTKATPAFALTMEANAVTGQPITIAVSALQAGGRYPTGPVVLSVDGAPAGSAVPLANGTASISYVPTTGPHNVTASYGGDSYFVAGSAAPVTFRAKHVTSTVVTASSTLLTYGQSATITATVSAGGELVSGTVDFFDDARKLNIDPVAVSAGQARFQPLALSTGTHAITAAFSGDLNMLASSSAAPLIITVNRAAAAISIPQLAGSAVYGRLSFAVAVTSGSGVPGGIVSLDEGSTNYGKATLANGAATLSPSTLGAGSHVLTAGYAGDANFSAATSQPLTLSVEKATPELIVRSTPSAVVSGQTVNLTASINCGGPATGSIEFSDAGSRINTAGISAGAASISYLVNGAGSHRISAAYGGDANCNAISSSLVLTVGQAATVVSAVTSDGAGTFGQSVKFSAAVSAVSPGSGVPGGIVTFKDGSIALGTAALEAGVASLSTSTLAAGTHEISAVYGGSADFAGSTSLTLAFAQGRASTVTALSYSRTPSTTVLEATVSSAAPGVPSGSVQFYSDGTSLGAAALLRTSGLPTATLSTGAITGSIVAAYLGDGTFNASQSAPVAVTAAPRAASDLALRVSPSPAVVGQAISCTLSLAWNGGAPLGGTIQLFDAGVLIAGAPAGVQVVFTTSFAAGSHNLTATYNGDGNYLPSTASYTLVVNRNAASVMLTADSTAVFGQKVTATARVMASAGGISAPVGNVTLMEGNTVLAAAPLANGLATLTLPLLEPGPHQITGIYGGDTNWDSTTSSALNIAVAKAATSIEIRAAGAALTATLAVKAPGAGAPSGTVEFVEAVTRQVLATAPLAGTGVTVSIPTDVGSKTVIAVYRGDGRFQTSSSAPETEFSILNAASYVSAEFAADQIVTVFCPELAKDTLAATTLPLPAILGGTTVVLTDSGGTSYPAMLFYVSPGQLTFRMPPEMAPGNATLRIATSAGMVATAGFRIGAVSPGLFAANGDGKGAASAQIVRVHADGSQNSPENTAAYDAANRKWAVVPIEPESDGDALVLVLYATGIRNHATPVTVKVNGQAVPVLYAGRQSTYYGLDQINVLLPASLQHGTAEVSILADGSTSNTVTLGFR